MSFAEPAFSPIQGPTLDRMATADRYNHWLLNRAKPFLGRRVLDVGAGVGVFTGVLADRRDVLALEPDPNLFPILRRRFSNHRNVTVRQAGIEDMADGGGFDAVVCFNVLEHIADDASALAKFAGSLREGGRLLLLVPAHPLLFGPLDRALHHERRYRKEELRTLLQAAGFVPEALRYVNPVGAVGWFISGRVLRRAQLDVQSLRLFDLLVPALRTCDRIRVPFGLSIWAVGRRA